MSDPQTWTRNDTPKSFYNPLNDAQSFEYRHENNTLETYSIPPLKTSTYPTYLADFLINQLLNALINDRNLGYLTPEKRAELRKEIEI